MTRVNELQTTILAAVVVLSAVTVGAFGITGVDASASGSSLGHGASNGNYTVNLPFDTDHYPASKNPGGPHNASINHFATTNQELFDSIDSPDGLEKLEWLVIGNPDVDFSECSTSNTAAFGIDRDNDDEGTFVDADLLSYLEKSDFRDNSIVLKFYDGDELGAKSRDDEGGKESGREDGDKNPELYPGDEIVAHQGYQSSAGPCYRMPDEPGWYQIDGMVNGTNWQGQFAEAELSSHYFYVCECDSEEAAYEQLGPPPGQDNPYASSGGSTPTPTPAQTATATPNESSSGGDSTASEPTATPTPERDTATATPASTTKSRDTATATATPQSQQTDAATATPDGTAATEAPQQTAGSTATATAAPNAGANRPPQNQQDEDLPRTPTAGAGPGFGLLAALGGILALALLARRR